MSFNTDWIFDDDRVVVVHRRIPDGRGECAAVGGVVESWGGGLDGNRLAVGDCRFSDWISGGMVLDEVGEEMA